MEKVLILSGSKSDSEIIAKAETALKEFGIEYVYHVASAHRNPDKVEKLVKETTAEVIIAAAGLSAALPGVVASRTIKPVIGLPIDSALDGLDSLLSIVQMPPNVPVATVGINNGRNAAILAIEILAIKDKKIAEKLIQFKEKMKE